MPSGAHSKSTWPKAGQTQKEIARSNEQVRMKGTPRIGWVKHDLRPTRRQFRIKPRRTILARARPLMGKTGTLSARARGMGFAITTYGSAP